MSHDTSANQPSDPTLAAPLTPIVTRRTTWSLDAAPAELEAVAGILRGIGSAGGSTRDWMDSAAYTVFAEGSWEGETAEAYLAHRGRLSEALADFRDTGTDAARALDETAETLRKGQAMLDMERDRLNAVSSVRLLGWVIFHPSDEDEAASVRSAVTATAEIKNWVDAQIALRRPAFDQAAASFQAITDAWQPRTVRHLNLNTGMGNRGADSTTRAKLDELAAAITVGDADVVTLQEVVEYNIDELLRLLGDDWQLAAYADPIPVEPEWDPDWDPDPDTADSEKLGYGNAILIRTGDTVELPAGAKPKEGNIDLSDPALSTGTQVVTGERPEERAAAVAEVTIREPDAQ